MSDISDLESSTYKEKCESVEEKLESLVYENELLQKQLDTAHETLLTLNEEKRQLLDKLVVFENLESSSRDDDSSSVSSEEERPTKKSRLSNPSSLKPKKPSKKNPQPPSSHHPPTTSNHTTHNATVTDGHMTPEEVERHLEARNKCNSRMIDMALPGKTPLTVPNEMFSPGASCDSDSNFDEEGSFKDTSPSNMGEDLY